MAGAWRIGQGNWGDPGYGVETEASGRIHNSSRGTLWVSWIFAGLWNLISVPVGFLGVWAALRTIETADIADVTIKIGIQGWLDAITT